VQAADGTDTHLSCILSLGDFVCLQLTWITLTGEVISIYHKIAHRTRLMTRGEPVLRICHVLSPHLYLSSPGTDAAAGASAAFAACSNLYANRNLGPSFSTPASLQNSTYAEILLTHAQDLYSFAVNASGGKQTYQTAVPQAGIAYSSSSYGDELTMAALFLAWATNSSDYYSQAETYYAQYSLRGKDDVFNWDSKTPGLAVLFAQLANSGASYAGNLSGWQAESERYFDRILNGGGPSFKTKGACDSPPPLRRIWDGDSRGPI
jgi:Glycosyl hydrolase family 9